MTTPRGTWLGRASILLPLLATTACASVPDLGTAPAMRSASEYAAAASLTPTGSAWPDKGWWLRYNDAQLNQLIDEAIAGSPDIEAAAARFRTAQGYAQQAGSKLLPSMDAFATSEFTKQERFEAAQQRQRRSKPVVRSRPVGQEPRGACRRDIGRRGGRLRAGPGAACADHRHCLDLCRAGATFPPARHAGIRPANPLGNAEAGRTAGRNWPRYARRAEAGRGPRVRSSRRSCSERGGDRTNPECTGGFDGQGSGSRPCNTASVGRRLRRCMAFPPMRRST